MARAACRQPILSAAFALASWALVAGAPALAAAPPEHAGPSLPPAEYKPLPVGTRIIYDDRTLKVTRTDGFLTVYKTSLRHQEWMKSYGVFAVHGANTYTTHVCYDIVIEINGEDKQKLEAFWPLKVGNKVKVEFREEGTFPSGTCPGTAETIWTVSLEVKKTDVIEINGNRYSTFLIEERGMGDHGPSYISRKWYQPDAGLIIKATRKWAGKDAGRPDVDSNWRPGDEEEYTLVDVKFPQGTKTHVLAATKAPSAPPSAAAPPPAARTLVRPPAGATARSDLQRQITVLKQLRDGGLITGQEFDFRKKGLLDRFVGAPKTATARLTAPESPPAALQAALAKYSGINFGRYYALVIGNNEYKHLPNLKTAADDARAVADILRDTYNFKVTLLINATRDDIVDALDDFREKLDDTTNLLIYYAGHGWLDEGADQGYWLPVDAKSNRRSKWVANSTITGALRALNSKHVMVVADSCYSGTLIRGIKVKENTPDYIRRMAGKRARLALTSGGLEPVADSGGGKHSPFAAAFLDVLKANTSVIDGTQLFSQMRRPVILNADQTPQYSDVRRAGHEGGDFLFVRRR